MTILRTWVIENMVEIICPTKLQVSGRFSAPIIIDSIVIIFYKATHNTGIAFNLITAKCFDPFSDEMLVFLFAIINCTISKYQSKNKIVRSFDGKIVKSLYCQISSLLH